MSAGHQSCQHAPIIFKVYFQDNVKAVNILGTLTWDNFDSLVRCSIDWRTLSNANEFIIVPYVIAFNSYWHVRVVGTIASVCVINNHIFKWFDPHPVKANIAFRT